MVGRNREILTLDAQFRAPGASLVVISGRRRSGKTTLLTQFMRRHPNSLYFLARRESSSRNLEYFRRAAAEFFGHPLQQSSAGDWNRTFREIASSGSQKMVLMIDEFQNIGQKDPTFPATLQYIWDTVLKNSRIMLVLSGSSMTQMRSQVLDYGSPLYGRSTAQATLGQLPFSRCSEFCDYDDPEKLVSLYAVAGGVPRYLETLGRYGDIMEGVEKELLDPESFLFGEVQASLQAEVGDVGSYSPILASISSGHCKLQDIADDLSMKQTSLTSYLKVLTDAGLVRREVPVTEEDPFRSKRGLYRVTDNLVAFWFRCIYPYLGLVERGETEKVMEKVRADFRGGAFRSAYADVCLGRTGEMAADGFWDFVPDTVGRYWGKESSVDIVGIDRRGGNLLLGACVPSGGPATPSVLDDARAESGKLAEAVGASRIRYVVFSLTGFAGEWPDDVDRIEGFDGR